MRDIRKADVDKFFSKILVTLKSHKDVGDVSLRIIHSGAGYPFSLIQKHIANVLRKRLYSLQHVYKSSHDVVKQIRTLRIAPEDRHNLICCKLDMRDFYMHGQPEQLVSGLFSHVYPDCLAKAYTNCLLHILKCQVVNDGFNKAIHRVVCGSGMGQVVSGDIADLKLSDLCELNWAANLAVQNTHKVHLYARYIQRRCINNLQLSLACKIAPNTFIKSNQSSWLNSVNS